MKAIQVLFFSVLLFLLLKSEVYAQIKVNVTQSTAEQNEGSQIEERKTYMGDRNLLSLKLYSFGNGIGALSYERIINPSNAIQVSGGLTYRDFLSETFGFTRSKEIETFAEKTIQKTGSYWEIAYKYYFDGYYDFDGYYISPSFSMRSYYFNGYKNATDFYKMNDASIRLGKMTESYVFEELKANFYVGVGFRGTTYEKNIDPTDTSPELVGEETISNNKILNSYWRPALYFGAQIGIGF